MVGIVYRAFRGEESLGETSTVRVLRDNAQDPRGVQDLLACLDPLTHIEVAGLVFYSNIESGAGLRRRFKVYRRYASCIDLLQYHKQATVPGYLCGVELGQGPYALVQFSAGAPSQILRDTMEAMRREVVDPVVVMTGEPGDGQEWL
jgi:hypothetical protein